MPVQGGVGNPHLSLQRIDPGTLGFSTPPAGSTDLFTMRAPNPPRFLGPGNAPTRPSTSAGARTGPSGHRPPRPGSEPHAPGPPRSPPGDDPSPPPPSPGSWTGNRAARDRSRAGPQAHIRQWGVGAPKRRFDVRGGASLCCWFACGSSPAGAPAVPVQAFGRWRERPPFLGRWCGTGGE